MMRHKPMLPTLSYHLPDGEGWSYEIKYDGFRSLLYIHETDIDLYSRNLKSLNPNFPEIRSAAEKIREQSQTGLPVLLDGELCVLDSNEKANFSSIQKRGRLKNEAKIRIQQFDTPATLLIFDFLVYDGKSIMNLPFEQRKKRLQQWMERYALPQVSMESEDRIQWIPCTHDGERLFHEVKMHHGEGVVAKRQNSLWLPGKRTDKWLKVKSLYSGFFIVSGYDEKNGYFHVSVVDGAQLRSVGVFSHGLEGQEREALIQIAKNNKIRKTGTLIDIAPRICVELVFLEIHENQLRQPRFTQFRLDMHWEDCTWEALQKQMDN